MPMATGSGLLQVLATDGAHYNPYSLLRSSDELFGLEPLGAAAGSQGPLLRLGLHHGERRRLISATLHVHERAGADR